MGWRGVIRSIAAHQRAELRRARDDLKQAEKIAAEQVVAQYERLLQLLLTVHHTCTPTVDWSEVAAAPPIEPPAPSSTQTDAAERALQSYRPGLFARLFGGHKAARAALEQGVEVARVADREETQRSLEAHAEALRSQEQERVVAQAILARDISQYVAALSGLEVFQELAEVTGTVEAKIVRPDFVTVEITLPPASEVAPRQQHALTQRGKLSTKAMPVTRANEIYQDYACGAALRASREVFAVLPVDWVCTTVKTELLNAKTGHQELQPVLSVLTPRATISALAFATLDPSEAMTNFVHRMGFKKRAGMTAIEPLSVQDAGSPVA